MAIQYDGEYKDSVVNALVVIRQLHKTQDSLAMVQQRYHTASTKSQQSILDGSFCLGENPSNEVGGCERKKEA